jgi:hypothetical protein
MLVSCTQPSIIQMGQYVGGIPSPPQKKVTNTPFDITFTAAAIQILII